MATDTVACPLLWAGTVRLAPMPVTVTSVALQFGEGTPTTVVIEVTTMANRWGFWTVRTSGSTAPG